MSTELRIPLTEIRVRFRAGSHRPITELDRLVMQAIRAGANSVSSLTPIFQLPDRLLVECLVDLMDMALLALDTGGGLFCLTEFGNRSLVQGLTSFGERLGAIEEVFFLREDLTGSIGSRRMVWYERKKGDMRAETVQGNTSFGEVERLLLQEIKANKDYQGMHLHSVESITPVRDGISFKVTIDAKSISDLGQWAHLQPLLVEEAKKRGVSYAGITQRDKSTDDQAWSEINLSKDDLLCTAENHESTLLDAINQAHSHLLIASAHVSEKMLNTLQDPIAAAMKRGVRVDVLWGLPSLDEGGDPHAKTIKSWSQAIRQSSGGSGDNLTVNAEPLNSDAKVLVWDIMEDGSYQAIVGSYNWLYGLDGQVAERPGSEVSVRINDPRLVGSICSTLAGWLDASGQQSSGISQRWRQIGLHLAQQDLLTVEQDKPVSKARVIFNEGHSEVFCEAQRNANQRLLVTSHKINRSATGGSNSSGGKLKWLATRKAVQNLKFVLVSGKAPKEGSWNKEDQDRLEELVGGIGGSMSLGEGTHARVLVYDDVAIVSSYNFLSTTHDKRQIGVMFRGGYIADALWVAFESQYPS